VGTQLRKTKVGPTSEPTWCLSYLAMGGGVIECGTSTQHESYRVGPNDASWPKTLPKIPINGLKLA
jgi:hypothetical protein